ncbi:MAG: hypothetical protein GY869_14275 [Planctomycetes bacterium]|nr:hypothetical protein [Planctomycetota bacterium]
MKRRLTFYVFVGFILLFWNIVGEQSVEAAPQAKIRAHYIAEGVNIAQLTDDGMSRAVTWAYHGDKVAFVRDMAGGTQKQLMIMNSDGTKEKAVTPIGYPFYVEWSWKGDKLAYLFSNSYERESQGGVYIYDIAANKKVSISTPYPRSSLEARDGPTWSPDDQFAAYKVRAGTTRRNEVRVADTRTGKFWQILPERGRVSSQKWSTTQPNRLCLSTPCSGTRSDAVVVDFQGRDFQQITDIGAESISVYGMTWSPDGQWIAYLSDIDMTQNERSLRRMDCWIARPDGSEARNLTNASSPATEKQLSMSVLKWSWDGRWILASGTRYEQQGNRIPTYYLIDPINGGYEPLLTFNPRETGIIDRFASSKWSWDSKKLIFLGKRLTVRNWGPRPTYERSRSVLKIMDLETRQIDDILVFDEELDRQEITGGSTRGGGRGGGGGGMSDMTFSPDNRSILITIQEVLSRSDRLYKPDVYRVDLPDRFVHASAALSNGPPMGRPESENPSLFATELTVNPVVAGDNSISGAQQNFSLAPENQADLVTKVISPTHMTVEEAMASIPGEYATYVNLNPTRNMILFKGPEEVLKEFRNDLKLVDTPPPHVLVDLLAVELTDEANRNLGLDWTYAEGHFSFFQPVGNAIRDLTPDPLLGGITTYPGVGQAFYQGVGTLPREFFIRLNTLVMDGEGTILANPRTVAMSGKESMIQMRKTLNYFFNEGYDTSGRPVVKKSDISADTEGRITPTLLADGRIHLLVDIKVGSFTFTPEAGLPEQTNRQSTTEVTVQNGETIVIGGLRQQEMSHVEVKVPILGDIPLLGWLFKKQESIVRHSVLTIFITPRVMTPDNPRPDWAISSVDDFKRTPIIEDKSQDLMKIK